MKYLKATYRLGWILFLTPTFLSLWAAGRVLVFAYPEWIARWRAFIFRRWSRALLWVLNVKISCTGKAPLPPFFLVCNHLSYLDILVLASQVDAVFISKKEVSGWPILGFICRSMDTIFIDRNNIRDLPRVSAEVERFISVGTGVVLFPEGTSTQGSIVKSFHASLLSAPARLEFPVSWSNLSYKTDPRDPSAHLAVCWWGDVPFVPHFVNLCGLRHIEAQVDFGSTQVREADRKRLADTLWREVSANLTSSVR
jgi:1-acyl-sn-glycerol-3-phosphate acyltransferase